MDNLTALPPATLAAGLVLQLLLGRWLTRAAKGWLAVAAAAASFAAAATMLPAIAAGRIADTSFFAWDQGVSFRYHVDGLSMVFVLMATGIGTAILLYSVRYMEHEAEGTTRFYALMLTFMGGLVNLVCSADLLVCYVSWEVIGLCSYFLVGFWYKDPAASKGARKVLVMTHLPGYALLAAILALHGHTGTFLWTDPSLAASFTSTIFVLMLVPAMAKSVMFPLHTWIPEAMNAPTPVSALLHSACYVKAGVYLIARMYSFGPWLPQWHTAVLALASATMLVGALGALVQTDLKRLLAFSTVSQLGHIITGLALGTTLGMAAGIFYCLSHGLFKATLFLCAGAVQHATGTKDLRRLGGLSASMPHTALIWIVATAAIVGVPLGNGFVAKWLLFTAALDAGQVIVVAVAWLASVFTAVYMLRATVSVFYGELPEWLRGRTVREVSPSMQAGMGILALLCIVFGVAPQLLMTWVVAPAVRSLGFQWTLNVSWLGVQTTSSGVPVTGGAVVIVAALAAGFLVSRLARRPKAAPVAVFTGGDPLPGAYATVGAADFVDIAETAFAPVNKAVDPDPIYLALWSAVKKIADRLDAPLTSLGERHALAATMAIAAVVFLVALVL